MLQILGLSSDGMDSLVSPARRPRPQSRTWGLLSPSAQPPGLVWPQPGLPGLLWTVCAWGVPVPCPRTPCGRCTTLFLQKQSECERAEQRASRQICQVRSNSLPQEHLSGRDEERHPVGTRNKNHTNNKINERCPDPQRLPEPRRRRQSPGQFR